MTSSSDSPVQLVSPISDDTSTKARRTQGITRGNARKTFNFLGPLGRFWRKFKRHRPLLAFPEDVLCREAVVLPVVPPYICGTCWKGVIANQLGLLGPPITEDEPPGQYSGGYTYKMSEEEMKGNSEWGCRWCELLIGHVSSSMRTKSTSPVSPSENIMEIIVGTNSERDCVTVAMNDMFGWEGYVYTTEDDPAAAYIPGRSLICEVGSERALSLAMDLVHDCELNHSDCPPLSESYCHLPTRVIDCSYPSRPRLFISNGTRARYIALSYVWGEDQTHKTTTENIDSYTCSIEIQSLPQTIVDAIQVTHGLGIRYLWIDSLCIIQDSNDDKDHELARMRHVYSDAYLTIIAASATRVSEGFLEPRTDKFGAAAVELPFILADTTPGSIFLSSWQGRGQKYAPEQERVHTRAWCMQEYFLAPRKLIFANHTLQYCCFGGTRNIGGADCKWWISSEADPPPFRHLPKLLLPSPSASPTEDAAARESVEALRKAWNATVENYTKRAVSVSSDKLVALSSLAEEFSHVIQSPYLAGLWERTLPMDLLWSMSSTAHVAARPQAYRAPSWSWAAVDGAVNAGNVHKDETCIAEVVRCETVLLKAELPFGEVTDGTLVLRARVFDDCVVREDPGSTGRCLVDKRRMHRLGYCRFDGDEAGIECGARRVSAVPVYSDSDRWLDSQDRLLQGIIVERVDTASSQREGEVTKYRRIGFFHSGSWDDGVKWLEEVPEIEITIV